jgi:hypothetical protein
VLFKNLYSGGSLFFYFYFFLELVGVSVFLLDGVEAFAEGDLAVVALGVLTAAAGDFVVFTSVFLAGVVVVLVAAALLGDFAGVVVIVSDLVGVLVADLGVGEEDSAFFADLEVLAGVSAFLGVSVVTTFLGVSTAADFLGVSEAFEVFLEAGEGAGAGDSVSFASAFFGVSTAAAFLEVLAAVFFGVSEVFEAFLEAGEEAGAEDSVSFTSAFFGIALPFSFTMIFLVEGASTSSEAEEGAARLPFGDLTVSVASLAFLVFPFLELDEASVD